MKKGLIYALTTAASIATSGCGSNSIQQHPLSAHIPENESRPFFGSSPDKSAQVENPEIDNIIASLYETYSDLADRIVEFCMDQTTQRSIRITYTNPKSQNHCPATSTTFSPLEYWNLADVDTLGDFEWTDTDKEGAEKCNRVFRRCLEKEMISPTVIQTAENKFEPAGFLAPELISYMRGKIVLIYQHAPKPVDTINSCVNRAQTAFDKKSLPIFQELKEEEPNFDGKWFTGYRQYRLGLEVFPFANRLSNCLADAALPYEKAQLKK